MAEFADAPDLKSLITSRASSSLARGTVASVLCYREARVLVHRPQWALCKSSHHSFHIHELTDYTHCWYDGINDVHECGLKAEYFYMYLEGLTIVV